MVIHGLTGARDREETLARLERIVESGGLKSSAERRRLGIEVETMSPKGDIASGIDTGVPCKVGATAGYGEGIYFGLRPEIIKRRDVFFSNTDFGAGESRYDEYTHYAKKIGQGKIFSPPGHAARIKHFSFGLDAYNEVWFRHEISWDEIDTLFVRADLIRAVSERVEGWIRSTSLPGHIRVECFNGNVNDHIKRRSGELAEAHQPIGIVV
jgi:hypothetical protein